MIFKDHFSVQATEYAKFRPRYPEELFDYLAGIAPAHEMAWDCATGNGQAAVALAERFDHVIATDASEKQIESAERRNNIDYRVAAAEASGMESGKIDVVTVAQALHWFDLERFYAEVKRVLKPNGAIAVWSYNLLEITPKIDRVVNRFYREIVGEFWPPERRIIEKGYAHVPFPFVELPAPPFKMTAHWTLDHLIGYLKTWSATQRYIAEKGADPLAMIDVDLRAAWEDENQRTINWPLTIRIGRRSS